MKEKFSKIYPIVHCILVLSTVVFKSFESVLWIIILMLSNIFLIISLKDQIKEKVGIKIFAGVTIILSVWCILYQVYKFIL